MTVVQAEPAKDIDPQAGQNTPPPVNTDGDDHGDWFNSLNDEAKKEILKLRNESGKYRTKSKENDTELKRLQDLEKQVKAEKQKKLEDEGKLQEVIAEKEKELNELKPLKDENDEYKSFYQSLLENELKGLDEKYVSLILNSTSTIKEKYETAKQFKSDINKKTNSPASNPPGGVQFNTATLKEQYDKADTKEKARILFELEKTNPELYADLMRT